MTLADPLPCPFCGAHLEWHEATPDEEPRSAWYHPGNYGSCILARRGVFSSDVPLWNRRAAHARKDDA